MGRINQHILDVDLSRQDIQSLNDADALSSLLARMGYNTNARTIQTPANLGITAEGTVRPIKKIELLADHEGLFQAYVFEVVSVTVVLTRSLARAFRNRSGNYLLVLTSDYQQLDFVLLERFLPEATGKPAGPAPPLAGIRPRVLTVDRRNPGPVPLRVLRRFTWTEPDPFAQYDKLLSAYAVADWSEEHFNNRALFSDYYLLRRLQERPEWNEDPKSAYRQLRELFETVRGRCVGRDKAALVREWLDPALRCLGFEMAPGEKTSTDAIKPDGFLRTPGDASAEPLASCLIYPWGRSLDGKDDTRDKETPEENPGAVVVSLLEQGRSSWVVLTNGNLWRLYARDAHSRATNYYEIDLAETLAQNVSSSSDPGETFRYFWLLFRRQAFEPAEIEREGRTQRLCLLDRLLLESERIAETTIDAAKSYRFFHWELEFPEVFYGPRPGSQQAIERLEDAGFDAVIGNPPYVRVQELRQTNSALADFLGERYRSAVRNFDLYLPFFEMGLSISTGQVSYIAPNKWFATDYGVGLRRLVAERKALVRVVDFKDYQLFPEATNYTCILSLSRKPGDAFVFVDASSGSIGNEISLSLKDLPGEGGAWSFACEAEGALMISSIVCTA
jgi:hypothetical protein